MMNRRKNSGRRGAIRIALLTIALLGAAGTTAASPPPWAPAHGYRAKNAHSHGRHSHGHSHRRERVVSAPFIGIPDGQCHRETVGALLGGALGGALGSRAGSGSGQLAATAAGTLVGLIVGGSIGRSMDQVDRYCVSRTLEEAADQHSVIWVDPDHDARYRVTPTATWQREGRYCREYRTEAVIGGRREETWGVACRQPDGSWRVSG